MRTTTQVLNIVKYSTSIIQKAPTKTVIPLKVDQDKSSSSSGGPQRQVRGSNGQ